MPKITSWFQEGNCNICKKKALVRVLIDNELQVFVCAKCVEGSKGNLSISDVLKKYGKRTKN